jgi:hypothetical protein
MNTNLAQYLTAIGMSEALRNRVQEVFEFYKALCPDEIKAAFVTDYIKEDGSREFENLWFFSTEYMMEAKQFVTKDDFDLTPILNKVKYWTLQKSDYDFKKASEKSRLHVHLILNTGISGDLKASKENCDYLKEIILKHIIPNLMQ